MTKAFTKTFYSNKTGRLLKVNVKEVHVAKNPSKNATITQAYYFKDDALIYMREKSTLRPRSTIDAGYLKGRPLEVTKSPLDGEYLFRAKNLLKEFK